MTADAPPAGVQDARDWRPDAGTGLVALLGWPVGHSLSPAMHNAGFRALGWNLSYLGFATPPERLGDAVRGLEALGCRGFNLTVPHKEAVIDLLDEVDARARQAGAVNTVANRDGRLIGYNTDGAGFIASLHAAGFDPRGRSVLMFGAGGAARGVTLALILAGAARIWVANRTHARAETLAGALNASVAGGVVAAVPLDAGAIAEVLPAAGLIVNATSVGLAGKAGPGPQTVWDDFRSCRPEALVVDLVYTPEQTPFLSRASQAGLKTCGGLGMLVHQAALAWDVWFGAPAPVDVFYAAARAEMAAREEAAPAL